METVTNINENDLAISGTRGSSGLGSQRREQMERSTWRKDRVRQEATSGESNKLRFNVIEMGANL